MNQERLLTVLQAPYSSEKAFSNERQYVFKVIKSATKLEIKKAVENLFGVSVANVSVLNVKGKKKRFGQMMGQRQSWKKAYVKLTADSKLIETDVAS